MDVADSLHVSARPDIRMAILAGEFHRFACPMCNRFMLVDKVFAYTDFPRNQWFTVVPAANLPDRAEWIAFAERSFRAVFVERAAPMVQTWAPRFTRRVIFGLASLREKLVAFDAGLDDRRLEQLKVDLVESGRLIYIPGGYCHLVGVTSDELTFEWAGGDDPATHEVLVPRHEYDAVDDRTNSETPWATQLLTTPVVDMRELYVPATEPVTA
ncbi:MAG: hypothetical protein H0T79_13765 [Deltaproteobacteria bacterium]|nr:hypothetical protein [Deltaproteobacteria bacterium]